MIKEELKKLFNADVQPFEKNDITTSVLSDFDNLILDLIDEEKFMIEEDATRINLYFKKVKHTPNKYPRAYGQIKKKPLEG